MAFFIVRQFEITYGTFIFFEMIGYISGSDDFMSKKRTEDFIEVFFFDHN